MNTAKQRKPFEEMNAAERIEFAHDVVAAFKKDIDSGSVVPELPPHTLILTPAKIYQVYASDNEQSGSIHGYYLDYGRALEFAKNCGWYGSSGKVSELLFGYTDGTNYYIVKDIKLTDVEVAKTEARNVRINQIKAKLTPEEIELLGLTQPQL
jgi:hypothetical protein